MRARTIFHALSTRAPAIVLFTLCAALLGYWADAPLWLPYGLATVTGGLALVVLGARNRRRQLSAEDDPDSSTDANWIARELSGRGSPPGFYLLEFLGLVTAMLTGFDGPYATPAWASLALGAAWGIANTSVSTGAGVER